MTSGTCSTAAIFIPSCVAPVCIPPSPMVVRPTKPFSPFIRLASNLPTTTGDHCAEMADHRELPGLRTTAMNIPVSPAHRSLPRTKISARDVDQRFAERGAAGLVANERGEDVTLLQKHPASRTDRFLATADVNATGNHAPAVKAGQFLLENTRQQHPAKRFEKTLVRRNPGLFSGAAFGRLKHPKMLPASRKGGKWFSPELRMRWRPNDPFETSRALRNSIG